MYMRKNVQRNKSEAISVHFVFGEYFVCCSNLLFILVSFLFVAWVEFGILFTVRFGRHILVLLFVGVTVPLLFCPIAISLLLCHEIH